MKLTFHQKEALTALIHIAYDRASGALSELAGYRVNLDLPRIAMLPVEEIPASLSREIKGNSASVSQVFSGPIAGTALLILDEKAALALSELLTDRPPSDQTFNAQAREMVTEVGNILLNACLGVFGNLLQVQVTFAVPRIEVATVDAIVRSTTGSADYLDYAVLVPTCFRLRANTVAGFLLIVVGSNSLDRLLTDVERWHAGQRTASV